ncbi:uncharacterized protein M6B38_161020 [Iris pallida]|uniref:Dof zinc finger protein n=1 Tax=Iris pallida TaxID=29817 RepID=A0AAX6EYM1_IRIPA|nr:uncharacterized protein M6B38_161020 [Iris pallida]
MIQELLGAVVEDRKLLSKIPTSQLHVDVSSPTTSSPSQSAASSPSSASSEALRCPRCDSSNTKFCYYNNYNLTQPRHFCKTCRRYWTKGGALRNVPIGGGCRKTRAAATVVITGGTKSARPVAADASRMGSGGAHGHGGLQDVHDLLPSSPLLWASRSIPHSSHLLALLRASQAQQNQSHSLLDYCVKEEGAMAGAPMTMCTGPLAPNLCNNNNRNESSLQLQYQQHQNLFLADTPTSSGIQELYQRLQAPASWGSGDNLLHKTISNGNNNVGVVSSSAATAATMAAATTTTTAAAAASIMEPMPLLLSGGDQFGYWNPALSWAGLPTANGAFP